MHDATGPGTLISDNINSRGVKIIGSRDGITAIRIKNNRMLMEYGYLCRILNVFQKYQTPVDMVTTSEVAVGITIDDNSSLPQISKELDLFGDIEVEENNTHIALVSNDLSADANFLADTLKALSNISVKMVSFGAGRHSLNILIDGAHKTRALQSLKAILSK